jgi:hypothetical protein
LVLNHNVRLAVSMYSPLMDLRFAFAADILKALSSAAAASSTAPYRDTTL